MAEHDGDWLPNLPDEALEQHLSPLSAEDEQLVRALREQYSLTRTHQARALARGWERIQQTQQSPAVPFTRKTSQGLLVPAQDEMKRIEPMREIPSDKRQPGRFKRVFNILIAAALLAVLAGSLALVYSHVGSQTGLGSGGTPVAATPTQVGSTPTQASSTPTQVGSTPTQAGITPQPAGTQTNGQGSLDWPVGTSCYWANYRYHQLSSYWVSWTGNANQWLQRARAAGWHWSTSPHVPSIVILMSYVQGASQDGHVAVVESLVNATTVKTSNMDWSANGGGWDKVSYANFTTGPGVYFIWR